MQGQRSTIDPFPDAFEFSHVSGTSRTVADQQHLWNDMLNPAESRIANYLPSASNPNIAYTDAVSHSARSLSGWNLGESSSSDSTRNQITNRDEGKVQHGWSSSSTTHAGAAPLLEEQRYEQANCFGGLDINLNNNQMENGPLFLESSSSGDVPQNLNLNAGHSGDSGSAGPSGQVMESGICPFLQKPSGPEAEHLPHVGGSSNPFGTAPGSVGCTTNENDGRPGCSIDGRRSSCKRKAVEGEVSGQLSLGGSPSCFNRAETSAWHAASGSARSLSISNPIENAHARVVTSPVPLNPHFGISVRAVASDSQPVLSGSGIVESSQRNSRLRINPTPQQDSAPLNLTPEGDVMSSNVRLSHQPSSRLLSSNQSLVLEPAVGNTNPQIQPRVIHVPGLQRRVHPFPWNGASSSRVGSSSSSSAVPVDRSSFLLEDVHPRISQRTIPEHPMFSPASDIRNMPQDPTNWSLVTGNATIPQNAVSSSQIGSSSRIHGFPAPPWIPLQNPLNPRPQRLSEARRSLAPSSGSESGGQSSGIPLLMRSGPSTSQEMNHHGHLQVHSRSGGWIQGDGVRGGPMSFRTFAAGIEGRSRLLSEIRSVLDFLRRGGSVTFEDFALLNQSILFGVTDLHDRHRDMRLDVDNMSYEELLALEERIGNVSTGLSEENILKHMKQRRFISITMVDPSEVEPCCICQEEYSEGEDLGVLECGHDFHTGCIKQWLMQKNLCPICKTTGLVTREGSSKPI